MAEYTPGSWERSSPSSTAIRQKGGGPLVGIGYGPTPAEARVNAVLIAQAPAMYEALADAVRWLDAIAEKMGESALVSMMPNNCHGRPDMRKVLALAEGKQAQP